MSKRYIDIDSSYRNRDRFPNPSQFDILISQSGRRSTVYNSIDPISESAMIFPPPNIKYNDIYNTYSWMYITSISPLTYQIDGIQINGMEYSTPPDAENYFINKYIENITDGSFRRIIKYHTEPSIIHYDTGLVDNSMTNTDSSILILGSNTIPFTFHSDVENYYVGKYITVSSQTRRIVGYNPSDPAHGNLPVCIITPNWHGDPSSFGGTAYTIFDDKACYITIDTQFNAGQVSTYPPVLAAVNETQYRIRGDTPIEVGTFSSSSNGNMFILPASSSFIHNYYSGMYLWLTSTNQYYLITEYNGDTHTGTAIRQIRPNINIGDPYNILQFSNDNFAPLVCTGSQVSEQQMSCYEIELISLILPNLILDSGFGNLIAFYPYVYVEFVNLSMMNTNILYSNNPHARKVLFKVPIDDVITPNISSFITVDGHGMVQTIKFKPFDNFFVSVYLPNGELFKTKEADYVSPSLPNPNVQISMTFAIRKLEANSEDVYENAYTIPGEYVYTFPF